MASKVSLYSDLGGLVLDRVELEIYDVDYILDATRDLSCAASFLEEMASCFEMGFEESYRLDRILFECCMVSRDRCVGAGFSGDKRRRDLLEAVISVGDYSHPGHPALRFCEPSALKGFSGSSLGVYDRAFSPYDNSGRSLPRASVSTGVVDLSNGRRVMGPGLRVFSYDSDCSRKESDLVLIKPFGSLYLVKAR